MTNTTNEAPRPRRDIYREITDRIIQAMEENKAPWQRPWTELAEFGMPQNGMSGRNYHGVNSVLLFLTAQERGYGDSRWMTFKQANEQGYKIWKGEKSTPVYFYKPFTIEEKDKQTGEMVKREIPYLCEYRVFNWQQIDGMPSQAKREPDWNPIEQVEALIKRHNPEIRIGGNQAYYSPSGDFIQMPKAQFPDEGAWYGTLLHEMAHWTGAPHRLNRQFGRFGDASYAKEELVAQLTSAFLCSSLQVPMSLDNHAAYLSSWVKILQDDKYAIFRSARAAEQASDLILFRTQPEEQPAPTVAATEAPVPSPQLEQKRRFQRVGEQMLAEQGIQLPWQKARPKPASDSTSSGFNRGATIDMQ
jgi:antirestriction protein ArdC